MDNGKEQGGLEYIEKPERVSISDEQLAQKLSEFAEKFGVDAVLVEGFQPNAVNMYATGDAEIDRDFRSVQNINKHATLIRTEELYDALAVLQPGEVAFGDIDGRANNRKTRRTNRKGKTRQTLWQDSAIWQGEPYKRMVQGVVDSAHMGVNRSDTIFESVSANSLNYASVVGEDSGIDPSFDLCNIWAPEQVELYRRRLFAEEMESDTLPFGAVTERLQTKGLVDLTKETLDARFDNFKAIAQLEVVSFILSDMIALCKGGGNKQRHALALFGKFKQSFFNDDFEGKLNMVDELVGIFDNYSKQERQPQARRYLSALSERARKLAETMRSSVLSFQPLYRGLGYELPSALQEAEVEGDDIQAILPELPSDNEGIEDEDEPIDEELLMEINDWSSQLTERAASVLAPWQMSASRRKNAGFGNFERQLTEGAVDHLGRLILDPIPRDTTREIIGVLVCLSNFASQPDVNIGQQRLQASLGEIYQLRREIALLRLFAAENNVRGISYPGVSYVNERVDQIRSSWAAYGQIIREMWPEFKGAVTAQKIERLLFEEADESVAAHDAEPEPHVQNDEALLDLAGNIAKQLDKVILPPDATVEDLERELRRIGATETSVTEIEWQRLRDLVVISNLFGGTLYRSKEGALGNAPPYFVGVVTYEGETYAIAESPVFGNATYIVAEKHVPGTWLEVLELTKRDARSVGASKVVHPKRATRRQHIDRVYDKILELHAIEGFAQGR